MLGTFKDPKPNSWYNEDEDENEGKTKCDFCGEFKDDQIIIEIENTVVCTECLECDQCYKDEFETDEPEKTFTVRHGPILCHTCAEEWDEEKYLDGVEDWRDREQI